MGVASECEWFSLFLREERSPEEALERLNTALPRGLRIIAVDSLPVQAKCADSSRETYRMECLGSEAEAEEFSAAWGRVAAAAALPWRREGKKGPRDLDARAFFAHITYDKVGCSTLDIDWSAGYVSPLALCLHALAAVGHEAALQRVRLTRMA